MNRTELINKLVDAAEIPVSEGEMFLEMFLKRVSSEITPGHNYYLPQLGTFIFEKGPDDESVFTFPEMDENVSFTLPREEKVFSYSKFSLSIGKPLFPKAGKSEKFNYLIRPNENISSLEAKAEKLSFLVEEAGLNSDDFDSGELSIFTDTIDIPEDADSNSLDSEDEQLNGKADITVIEDLGDEVTPLAEKDDILSSIDTGITEDELPDNSETGIIELNDTEETEVLYVENELLDTEDDETSNEATDLSEIKEEELALSKEETPEEPEEDGIVLVEDMQSEVVDFDEDDLASYKETEAVYEETPEVTEEISLETNFEEIAEKYAQEEKVEEEEDLSEVESFTLSAETETLEIQSPPDEDKESFKSLVPEEDDYKFLPEDISKEQNEASPEIKSNDDADISENFQRVKSLTREFLSFNEQNRKEDKLTWDFGESEEIDKDIKAITKSFDEPDKNVPSNKDGYTFIQAKRSTMEWSPGTLPDLENILPEESKIPEETYLYDEKEAGTDDIVTDTVRVKNLKKREQIRLKPFIIAAGIIVLLVITVLAYYKINSGSTSSAENIEPTIIERNDPVPVMIIGEVEKTGTEEDESVPAFRQPAAITSSEEETLAVKVADMLFMKNGLYFVQVSSWKVKSNAIKHSDRYLLLGYQTEIQTTINNSIKWYRVLVGGFKTTREVEEFKQL